MVTEYGSFPGVQVSVAGGGITAVAIGDDEKVVLFGAANYQNDGSFPSDGEEDSLESSVDGSVETPEQINARRQADATFGASSDLADGMREALANGANIEFLYGVAPKRVNVVDEVAGSQSGTLTNAPIWEDDVSDESDIENIVFSDTTDGDLDVIYDYTSPPAQPSEVDTVAINPLTGEYNAGDAATGEYEVDYKYLEWNSAFTATSVENVVNDDESAIFCALTDSDSVSEDLQSQADSMRGTYQLVNALSGAEPNDNQVVTTDGASVESDYSNYQRTDARYDTTNYSSANNSVDQDYYFKFAPVRQENSSSTVLGGIAGVFGGNPLDDPIYNDEVTGYDALEQSFTKTDADNMRGENVIPLRQAGTIRLKDNLSTSTETDWERDFWRRRLADRIILIGKNVGDQILGEINNPETRRATARLIRNEIRELVNDGLLRPNTDSETNWYVDVYEDSQNVNEVNVDIGFTPFGIVKRVDESITINT
jgi:hypothetical protein